jgi:hypothetical protein
LAGTFHPRGLPSGTSLLSRLSHGWQEAEAGPDDPAALGRSLDAPAVRAGERLDYVQAMGTMVGLAAAPGTAEVFGFDLDVTGILLGADGEELAAAV